MTSSEKFNSTNASDMDVEQQTELMYKDDTIWTAVFKADKVAIDHLIADDPSVIHTRGAVGECPIHMLFLYGTDAHLDIARDLLKRFPNIVTQTYNKTIYYGENVLHLAIVKRNAALIEWLLSEDHLAAHRTKLLQARATGDFFKIGQPSYYGETPLGFACCTNQWDLAEILLRHGADMDAIDTNGNTILHVLVICNLPDIYEKFKAHWIERNATSEPTGSSETVRSSVKIWNRVNKDNLTPLTLAADIGRTRMLLWLLQERKKIQWSYGDISCLLHPLDQLDLDLQTDVKDRPLSVLEVIINNNSAQLIHPIIISLTDKKWKHFAFRVLRQRFIFTFVYLLVFLATTVLEQTTVEPADATNPSKKINIPRLLHQCTCALGHFIVIAGALWKSGREIREMCTAGLRGYLGSSGSVFLENLLSCSFCVCILSARILRLCQVEMEAILLAVASLIGWTYMLFFTMPFRFTGPFVIMIYKMLFNDVLRFCIIYVIFLAGFSQSFFILFNSDGLSGYIGSIKHCFLGLLGDFDLDYYIEAPFPIASVTLLIFYVVLITILLLNLLIAMMGDTFADVKKSAKKLWHLERTRIALDIERNMSIAERKLPRNKYWVVVQGERYLQVEQVNNELFNVKEDETDED